MDFFFSVGICHGWQIYLKDMIQISGRKKSDLVSALLEVRPPLFFWKFILNLINLINVIKSTSIDLAFLSSLLESAITLKLNENEWLAKSCSSTTHTKENHQESSQMCVSRRVWHLGIFTVWPVYKFEHSFNQKRLLFLPTSTHLSCNHYWYCLVPSLLENE